MKTLVARWAHLATPWSILMLMLQRICLYFTFMIMRTFIRMRGIQTQVSGMACLDLWVLNLQSADHVRCSLLLVLAAGWGQEVAIYVRFLSFSPLLVVRSILDCNDEITREELRSGEIIVNFHRCFNNETKTIMNALDRSLFQWFQLQTYRSCPLIFHTKLYVKHTENLDTCLKERQRSQAFYVKCIMIWLQFL